MPAAGPGAAWDHGPVDTGRLLSWVSLLKADGIAFEPRETPEPAFVVASVEPTTGDPELVSVTAAGDPGPWWIDRRTMRPQRIPEGALTPEAQVVRAADFGDRVQLALGEPVLVRVGVLGERLLVEGLRPLTLRTEFTNTGYRKLAALTANASTLAPLSIDAIDRALRLEAEDVEEPRVRRIYGRAYRRMDAHHTPFAGNEARAARRAVSRLTRLGRYVMLAVDYERAFRTELARAIPGRDVQTCDPLDTQDLLTILHHRMALVTRALSLLERARLSTLSLLPVIEAAVGPTPRATLDALAAPIRTRRRQTIDGKLLAMAEQCAQRDAQTARPHAQASAKWDALRSTLKHVRILGMDVRPASMGESDAALREAIDEAVARERSEPEARRREAERMLLGMCLKSPLGLLSGPAVSALLLLLRRLAWAKGSVAESLSAALLRLRAAALEAGARLSAQGVVDGAEDALYMPLDELEQALSGELGAYAARVRLRREDDRRFRNFAAPQRIEGRRGSGALGRA